MTPPIDMEKVEEAAKGRDFYADLTDEERAEEGLPPREDPKKDPEPKPEEPEEEEEEEEEEEPIPSEEATDRLFQEIAGLNELLEERLPKPEPVSGVKTQDAWLEAALEHDDPIVRQLAEKIQENNQELTSLREEARVVRERAQLIEDNKAFDFVKQNYVIEGRRISEKEIEQVENYMLANPAVGSRVTIEEATRIVHPGAMRIGPKSPPAKGPGGSKNGQDSPVATIVDEGSAGGGAPTGPWKPRANETVESAVQAFGKSRGWIR